MCFGEHIFVGVSVSVFVRAEVCEWKCDSECVTVCVCDSMSACEYLLIFECACVCVSVVSKYVCVCL